MKNKDLLAILHCGAKGIDKWRALHPGADMDLSYMDLSGLDLSGADLSGADMSRVTLSDTVLRSAFLGRAVMTSAKLERTDFRDANLSGVNFGGSSCRDVDFFGAEIDRTDFRGVRFHRGNNLIFGGMDCWGRQIILTYDRGSDKHYVDVDLERWPSIDAAIDHFGPGYKGACDRVDIVATLKSMRSRLARQRKIGLPQVRK